MYFLGAWGAEKSGLVKPKKWATPCGSRLLEAHLPTGSPPPPPSASGDSDAVVQCALLPQSEASRDIAYVTDMPEALQVNLRLGAPERAVSELLTPSRSSKTMMIVDSLHSAQPGTLSSHTSVYLYKYCSTTSTKCSRLKWPSSIASARTASLWLTMNHRRTTLAAGPST